VLLRIIVVDEQSLVYCSPCSLTNPESPSWPSLFLLCCHSLCLSDPTDVEKIRKRESDCYALPVLAAWLFLFPFLERRHPIHLVACKLCPAGSCRVLDFARCRKKEKMHNCDNFGGAFHFGQPTPPALYSRPPLPSIKPCLASMREQQQVTIGLQPALRLRRRLRHRAPASASGSPAHPGRRAAFRCMQPRFPRPADLGP